MYILATDYSNPSDKEYTIYQSNVHFLLLLAIL